MDKITYFDVEFANSKNKSLCQIGLLCESYETGMRLSDPQMIYVDPEDGFDDNCVKVHGITAHTVKGALSFPKVWSSIEKYFTNAVVVGHNVAAADLDALVKNLNRYNLDIPVIYYVCTYELAKEYVPSFAVENYKLSTLCDFFGIQIEKAHDALADSIASSKLFQVLVKQYDIDINTHIKKYVPHDCKEFTQYVASSVLRKSICEFYGILRGFSIDNEINSEEIAYITNWKKEHQKYAAQPDVAAILSAIDRILTDGIVTVDEILTLQCSVRKYLDLVSTSPVTLATQILDGILKGITVDGEVSEAECKNLRQWLYDNIYLADHFPFNKTIELIDKVLEDSVITQEESEFITAAIGEMLNPVEVLRTQVNSVKGKSVCLSGNFAYGSKAEVEEYIVSHGGTIDKSVKKTTGILLIGDCECQAYSNDTYGTKVKKAMEYNSKGCNIQIIKEADLIRK